MHFRSGPMKMSTRRSDLKTLKVLKLEKKSKVVSK